MARISLEEIKLSKKADGIRANSRAIPPVRIKLIQMKSECFLANKAKGETKKNAEKSVQSIEYRIGRRLCSYWTEPSSCMFKV